MTLLPMGSTWKYFDGNSIPAINWNTNAFNDVSWQSGAAPLGYGETSIVTTIGYGGNANNKYITSYFRKSVNIENLETKTGFVVTTFVDDGAVIYVNGYEVGRSNMSSAAVSFYTVTIGANEGLEESFNIPISYLQEGENLIAVEVHQYYATTSDLIFNLQLTCLSTNTTSQIFPDLIYSGTLTSDLSLMAVYEESGEEPQEETTVIINELVSSNNVIEDEFGGKDDYLELYNNGDEDVNIAGWYISDTPANGTLAQIPSTDAGKTTIPAKGRLILWADDEPGQGVLHLGFKLGKDGESVVLSKMNTLGTVFIVDSVTYPFMNTNMSYSRKSDGSPEWVVQTTTFNSSNLLSSLESVPENMVNIYPTLVNESFTVLNASGLGLTITDLTGKTLHRSSCQSDNETIRTDFLKKGLYLVTVGNQNFKIVKR